MGSHAILQRRDDSPQDRDMVEEAYPVLIRQLWIVEHVKVDVVHDVVQFADVVGGVLFRLFLEITSDFHPPFEAEEVRLTITSHLFFEEGGGDGDYWSVFLGLYLVFCMFDESFLEQRFTLLVD